MRKMLALLAAVSLSSIAVSANATTAIYTINGIGSGSFGSSAFNDATFTLTLTGDTSSLLNNILPLSVSTISITGLGSATLNLATRLGFSTSNSAVFFSRAGGSGNDLFDFYVASPINLAASFGPVAGNNVFALNQFQNISTTGGNLSFSSASRVQFAGQIGAASGAVPEPATWAMMLVGFGAVGYAMRRQRKNAVAVSYA